MWIPYDIRASLKTDSDASTVSMSRADTAPRDFLVGFFLRNPVTQAWELDIAASASGQETSAGSSLPGATITFHGNDAGKLGEVIYRLNATSAEDALGRAHADFSRRLLAYLTAIGRGMAIAGWRIADSRHGARWRCTPFRPSAMHVDFATTGPLAPDLVPFAELFQRARNAPDAASRLLAGYAVIHEAATGNPALENAAASFRVAREMLIHAVAHDLTETLLDLDLAGLMGAMKPHHDRLLQPGGILAAMTGDLQAQRLLAQYANLADLAAHRLILSELRARAGNPTVAPAAHPDSVADFNAGSPSC